jgi:hypothetical protein
MANVQNGSLRKMMVINHLRIQNKMMKMSKMILNSKTRYLLIEVIRRMKNKY